MGWNPFKRPEQTKVLDPAGETVRVSDKLGAQVDVDQFSTLSDAERELVMLANELKSVGNEQAAQHVRETRVAMLVRQLADADKETIASLRRALKDL